MTQWIVSSNRQQLRPLLVAHGADSMNRIDLHAFGNCVMAHMLV